MHIHHVWPVAHEMIMNSSDRKALLNYFLLHGFQVCLRYYNIAHNHSAVTAGSKCSPASESHRRNDFKSIDDDIQVILRNRYLVFTALFNTFHSGYLFDLLNVEPAARRAGDSIISLHP